MTDNEDPKVIYKLDTDITLTPIKKLKRWQWWWLVFLNIGFLLIGQAVAILLLKFYYDKGGHSKWTTTLAQNAGFPLLFIPFILFPTIKEPTKSPRSTVVSVYIGLGALMVADHFLYSVGLAYLPTSTFWLVCATQLSFSSVFSFFINSQRYTILILNAIIVLTFSAFLVDVSDYSTSHMFAKSSYVLGFVCTICASGLSALLISVTQLSIEKVIKKETFAVVLELQIHTSIVASCVSIVGLFASGEWRWLRGEVASFGAGSLSYVMTLIWTSIAWQICSIGVVGLAFVVSPLFSNAISTLALCLSPLVAAIAFNHMMNGAKIIAVFLGVWGFATYIYQVCVDDLMARNIIRVETHKCPECSC